MPPNGNPQLYQAMNCRYCADVAKANGVDPLGTAAKTDHWLITEMQQPWPRSLIENPQVQPLIPLFKKLIFRRGILIRPIAIAKEMFPVCAPIIGVGRAYRNLNK